MHLANRKKFKADMEEEYFNKPVFDFSNISKPEEYQQE
jgi:hypothetical protein